MSTIELISIFKQSTPVSRGGEPMKRVPVSKSSAELFTHISKKTKTEGSLIAMGTLAGVKPDDVYKRVVDFEKLHDDASSFSVSAGSVGCIREL